MGAMKICPHCGQVLPLEAWLRTNARTLWTTAELIAQYGGSPATLGRELKRLGFAVRSIRHRRPDKSFTKKRAIYCVKPESFPAFKKATPRQIRRWLSNEQFKEKQAELYHAIGEIYADKEVPSIVKDRLVDAAARFTVQSASDRR